MRWNIRKTTPRGASTRIRRLAFLGGEVVSAMCPFCHHVTVLERGFYCTCGINGRNNCSCRGMVITCCMGAVAWYERRAAHQRAHDEDMREQKIRKRIRELIATGLAG